MCIPGTPGVVGTGWLQGLMGKAGKDPEHRRSVWECEMPTTQIVQGLADQAVVTMTSPIIRRRSEGPVDMVVSGGIEWYGLLPVSRLSNLFHSGLSCWNHISGIITAETKCASNRRGEGYTRSWDTTIQISRPTRDKMNWL